jgi:uncharacterized protein YdgA (DUF945 family)
MKKKSCIVLIRLGQVYSFMLIVAFGLAYFLSTYITKSLKTISDQINETSLSQKKQKNSIRSQQKKLTY